MELPRRFVVISKQEGKVYQLQSNYAWNLVIRYDMGVGKDFMMAEVVGG